MENQIPLSETLTEATLRDFAKYVRTPTSEDLKEIAEEQIENHPINQILREYARSHSTGNAGEFRLKLDSVEASIAYQAMWAHRLLNGNGTFLSDTPGEDTASKRRVLAMRYVNAVPYVCEKEMYRAIITPELPRHVIQSDLPFPTIWFCLDVQPRLTTQETKTSPKMPLLFDGQTNAVNYLDGFLAMQNGNLIRLLLFAMEVKQTGLKDGTEDLRPILIETQELRRGTVFPDDIKSRGDLNFVKEFLATLSFINSPYIVLDRRGLSRPARKRAGWHGSAPESSKVRFILLRSPLVRRDHQESHYDVDWKFRWLVRGHHRAQWCPSTRDHKLMWIAPYVKGPEGLPMKTTAYKVVR